MPTPTDIPLSTYQVSNAQYSQSEIILTQAFKASHWNCLVMYLSTICLIDKLTYLFPFLILFSTFFSPFSLFLVACTRLYKSLSVGRSVGWSVCRSVRYAVHFCVFLSVLIKFSQVFHIFHIFHIFSNESTRLMAIALFSIKFFLDASMRACLSICWSLGHIFFKMRNLLKMVEKAKIEDH